MSASLVGSEMCIRDSFPTKLEEALNAHPLLGNAAGEPGWDSPFYPERRERPGSNPVKGAL
eukprot:10395660-Alexandrium_andersonii.AAC.1